MSASASPCGPISLLAQCFVNEDKPFTLDELRTSIPAIDWMVWHETRKMWAVKTGSEQFWLSGPYQPRYAQLRQKLAAVAYAGTLNFCGPPLVHFADALQRHGRCMIEAHKAIVAEAKEAYGDLNVVEPQPGDDTRRLHMLDAWLLLELHGHHDPRQSDMNDLPTLSNPLAYGGR